MSVEEIVSWSLPVFPHNLLVVKQYCCSCVACLDLKEKQRQLLSAFVSSNISSVKTKEVSVPVDISLL